MFIDKNGNIQFSSLEEVRNNKEIVIEEINNWDIPSIEDIALTITNSINETFDATPDIDLDIEDILYGIKLGLEYAVNFFDTEIGDENVNLKINGYVNRCYLAMDMIMKELSK